MAILVAIYASSILTIKLHRQYLGLNMNREFDSYKISIVEKEFINTFGKRFDQTAEVHFCDRQGHELFCCNFGYLKADDIYELIANKERIYYDSCFIEDFSLANYRAQYMINPDEYIELNSLVITNSIFDTSKNSKIKIDFSRAYFNNQVNFENTFFLYDTSFFQSIFECESVNFEYTLIHADDFDFSEIKFTDGDFSMKNAIFTKGEKHFDKIQFGKGSKLFQNTHFGDGEISFNDTEFNAGRTSFKVAHFGKGKVEFNHAIFGYGEAIFERTHFGEGAVSFRTARFLNGKVDFTRSEFGVGAVSFINTEFGSGNISFVNASFNNGKVSFKLARFDGGDIDFHFASFGEGDVSFDRTNFGDGLIDFRAVEFLRGGISFYRSEFGKGDVVFEASVIKSGNMIFSNCITGPGSMNFNNAEYENATLIFDNINFVNDVVSFNAAKFGVLALKSCQLNRLFDMRLSRCKTLDFSDSIIRDIVDLAPETANIHLDSINLIGVRLLGRIYIDWRKSNIKDLVYNQDTDLRTKSEQFRLLKQNYYNLGNYADEDRAYLEFKRTELRADYQDEIGDDPFKKAIYGPVYIMRWIIFEKTGLYATDPVRVLVSMAFVYLVFSLVYIILPQFMHTDIVSSLGDPDKLSRVAKSFYHSGVTFFTIGYGDYYPSGIIRWLSSLEGFCGMFLMSYFTVAFVRKILR